MNIVIWNVLYMLYYNLTECDDINFNAEQHTREEKNKLT